jgi:DUF4097 and DUF4098 domain-containing protein YvlB
MSVFEFDFIPEHLAVLAPSADVTIRTRDDVAEASVSLLPADPEDDVALAIIEDAKIERRENMLSVVLPRPPADVRQFSAYGRNVVVTGSGYTVHQSGAGITIVNGQVISGNAVVVPKGRVKALILVPSGINASIDAEEILFLGSLKKVDANTVNGNIKIDTAIQVTASTKNGNVSIIEANVVHAETHNGNIGVNLVTERAVLRTHNGNIMAHTKTSDFSARTHNGNVMVTKGSGVALEEGAASTHNGNVSVTAR